MNVINTAGRIFNLPKERNRELEVAQSAWGTKGKKSMCLVTVLSEYSYCLIIALLRETDFRIVPQKVHCYSFLSKLNRIWISVITTNNSKISLESPQTFEKKGRSVVYVVSTRVKVCLWIVLRKSGVQMVCICFGFRIN